mgnify:CR=1 FL=1
MHIKAEIESIYRELVVIKVFGVPFFWGIPKLGSLPWGSVESKLKLQDWTIQSQITQFIRCVQICILFSDSDEIYSCVLIHTIILVI